MLQDKYILATKMREYFSKIGANTEELQDLYKRLNKNWNLPVMLSSDIISNRRSLDDYHESIAYWITKEVNSDIIPKFFTKNEIKTFDEMRYEDDEDKPIFPMKLQALQLADDQWITTMTIQELMNLRRHSYIHYNAETQRALKLTIKDGEVTYEPYVNPKAVREMRNLLCHGSFIPNVITFNISDNDEKADVVYKNGTLYIKDLTAFDITDGYNRFKAFETFYDNNPEWQFTIGVMITMFSVYKAKQFIHQEDQKTKMRKIDSDTYNQIDYTNQVIRRINEDPTCDYFHQLDGAGGNIMISIATRSLKYRLKHLIKTNADVIRTSKEIVNKLNELKDYKPELLERHWSMVETGIIFSIIYDTNTSDIVYVLDNITKEDRDRFLLNSTARPLSFTTLRFLTKYLEKRGGK